MQEVILSESFENEFLKAGNLYNLCFLDLKQLEELAHSWSTLLNFYTKLNALITKNFHSYSTDFYPLISKTSLLARSSNFEVAHKHFDWIFAGIIEANKEVSLVTFSYVDFSNQNIFLTMTLLSAYVDDPQRGNQILQEIRSRSFENSNVA